MENVSAVHSTVIYTLRHILFDMSYVSQIRRLQFQQSKSHGFKSTGPVSNLAKTSRPCASSSVSAHLKTQSIVCLLSHIINLICQYCCRVSWRCFAPLSYYTVVKILLLWDCDFLLPGKNAVKCKSMGSLFFTNFHVIKFTGKIEKQRKLKRHFTCALALRVKFASVCSSKLSFLSCK